MLEADLREAGLDAGTILRRDDAAGAPILG
jgi:hypothetical protein